MLTKWTCVVLVVLVNLQWITGKPMFGDLWCDLMCDDDDDTSTSVSTTTEDYDFLCDGCGRRRPATPPINVMIPPNPNGMNLTMFRMGNNGWNWQFSPWQGPPPGYPMGPPPGFPPGYPWYPPPVATPASPPASTPSVTTASPSSATAASTTQAPNTTASS